MSGHSKWAGIKHKKALVDRKRGKIWTKVSNMITVAARSGDDPETNFKLRLAIDKAKEVNMPKENIERSIKRGAGGLKGAEISEVTYEAYGPEGTALIIQVTTDNKNRAASDVRSTLTKHGGKMGGSGSVSWMFDQKGQIIIDLNNIKQEKREEIELLAIDAGAQDIEEQDKKLFIYTDYKDLEKVKKSLEEQEVRIESSEISLIPKNEVKISSEDSAKKMLKLMEALEDLDDVSEVSSNFDIPDDIMGELQ